MIAYIHFVQLLLSVALSVSIRFHLVWFSLVAYFSSVSSFPRVSFACDVLHPKVLCVSSHRQYSYVFYDSSSGTALLVYMRFTREPSQPIWLLEVLSGARSGMICIVTYCSC